MNKTDRLLRQVYDEMERANAIHGPMNSAHEALAVIREEYLEYEKEVFKKDRDLDHMREELIQLAAMAIKAVLCTCPEDGTPVTDREPCFQCGAPSRFHFCSVEHVDRALKSPFAEGKAFEKGAA